MNFRVYAVSLLVVSSLLMPGCGQVTMPPGLDPDGSTDGSPDGSTERPDAEASHDGAVEDAHGDASPLVMCDSKMALIHIDHLTVGVNPDTAGGLGLFVWSVIENDSPVDVSLSGLSVANVVSSANGPTFDIRPGDELSAVAIPAHHALGNLIPDTESLIQPLIGTEWSDDTTIMVFMASGLSSSETVFFVTADVMTGDLIAPISIRVDTYVGPAGFSVHSAQRVCFEPAG